jgi:hypothetical protein
MVALIVLSLVTCFLAYSNGANDNFKVVATLFGIGLAPGQADLRVVSGILLSWVLTLEDTIFVPNTFGPMQKVAQELGAPDYEPANHLLDDWYYDNLFGQQAYKCFACRVRKA